MSTVFAWIANAYGVIQAVGFLLMLVSLITERGEDPRFEGAKLIYRS